MSGHIDDLKHGVFRPSGNAGCEIIAIGKGASPHFRELVAVNKPASEAAVVASDLHTATWSPSENITEITVSVMYGGAAIDVGQEDGIFVVFDANSDLTASVWLSSSTAGADSTANTYRLFIPVNTSKTFYFTGYIERADCIASFNSVSNDFDIILEAS